MASAGLVAMALALASLGRGGAGDGLTAAEPRFVDLSEVFEVEKVVGHRIYWAGPRPGQRLELRQEPEGGVLFRYLPKSVAAGRRPTAFLTVGTYPVSGAAMALMRTARSAGARVIRVADGGLALPNPGSAGSVYLAYPRSGLQIEVYGPAPGMALKLIRSGMIEPVD